MKQFVSRGIILSRTDYGEADRILTVITPDQGKLSLLAKGVRREKSKLAGGIELFSVSQITFIKGRGKLDNLVSTRLIKHYDRIVKDIQRTMLGYELIKQLHRSTEPQTEAAYFVLAEQLFDALNDLSVPPELVQYWFTSRLLQIGGREPNLQTDQAQQKLELSQTYGFDFERMVFAPAVGGLFSSDHIKFLRLTFGGSRPHVLARVQGWERLLKVCQRLVQQLVHYAS